MALRDAHQALLKSPHTPLADSSATSPTPAPAHALGHSVGAGAGAGAGAGTRLGAATHAGIGAGIGSRAAGTTGAALQLGASDVRELLRGQGALSHLIETLQVATTSRAVADVLGAIRMLLRHNKQVRAPCALCYDLLTHQLLPSLSLSPN